VHAGVTVRAFDREGLERLFRYGARPLFSLERISIMPDGRVATRLRKPRRNGATHLVLEPLHFLARLSSIIPPPRYPLLRLSGVFAPRLPWRKSVVPRGPVSRGAALSATPPPKKRSKASSAAAPRILAGPEPPRPSQDAPAPSGPRTSLGSAVVKPAGGRIDWASLRRRIYLHDVLACLCGGRLRILADISERDAIAAILAHLGLPTEAPPLSRARSPSCDAA
jgi:Putative transposase